jgi:hypothetical protein
MSSMHAVEYCRRGPDAIKGDKDTCASGISCLRAQADPSIDRRLADMNEKESVLLSQS